MSHRIDIYIEYQGEQADFRIPTGITMGRFIELMQATLKNTSLPKPFTLALKYKDIWWDEMDLIKDLPIASGDIFVVVPTRSKQDTGEMK